MASPVAPSTLSEGRPITSHPSLTASIMENPKAKLCATFTASLTL